MDEIMFQFIFQGWNYLETQLGHHSHEIQEDPDSQGLHSHGTHGDPHLYGPQNGLHSQGPQGEPHFRGHQKGLH